MKEFEISWKKLLNEERIRESTVKRSNTDNRNEFESDYNRIIFSSAFRRLQDKTQVFPLENSDFIRTRLTHSLEVSAIAESIGISIERYLIKKENETGYKKEYEGKLRRILACVGLLHDIGNTPFGHFGEYAIQKYFKNYFKLNNDLGLNESQKKDFEKFDGNVQALRVISYLQSMKSKGGLNLTYGTLSALIKYPRSSLEGNSNTDKKISYKKFGYFQSENDLFENIINRTGLKNDNIVVRNPIAYILEAADDIAYLVSDMEDGFKKGFISLQYLKEEIIKVFYDNYKSENNEEDIKILSQISDCQNEYNPISMNLSNNFQNEIIKCFFDKIEFGGDSDFTRMQMLRIALQSYMISEVVTEFEKSYSAIMKGTYEKELLKNSTVSFLRNKLAEISKKKIYSNTYILKNELAGEKVISRLLELFIPAVIKNEDKRDDKDKRIYNLISVSYRDIYEKESQKNIYNKIQLVVDFISGMTDHYALQLYKQLQGIIIS